MKLPIQFPSDTDVIAEEAGRFSALSSQDRLQVIRGLLDAGALMLQNSPRSTFLRQHAAEQESASRQAVREFLARHAD
ncbi:MAG TPA: hypothetical protein VGI40_13530 [Pirellulaceae bacterium]|jgi:hypothetical protein